MRKLIKIQEDYFKILDEYFGDCYKYAKNKDKPFEEAAGKNFDLEPHICESILLNIIDKTSRFWKENYSILTKEISSLPGVKAYVGSQITMDVLDEVSRVGLYADTQIINDPLFYLPAALEINPNAGLVSTAWQCMHLLDKIEPYLEYESEHPTILITPDIGFLEPKLFENLAELHSKYSLKLSSEIMNREFKSDSDLKKYVTEQENFLDLLKTLIKSETSGNQLIRGLFDEVKDALEYLSISGSRVEDETEFLFVAYRNAILSQIAKASSNLASSSVFGAEPTFVERVVWDTFLWETKTDNKLINEKFKLGIDKDSLVLNALQLDDFKWLGNVPIDEIFKLREKGELQEIRNIFRTEIKEIENCSDEEFNDVVNQVKYNLETAFKKHQSEVSGLEQKYKRKIKMDKAGLLVGGTISAVSSMFPPLTALGMLIGGAGGADFLRTYIEYRKEKEELRKKPVGLLFNAKNIY